MLMMKPPPVPTMPWSAIALQRSMGVDESQVEVDRTDSFADLDISDDTDDDDDEDSESPEMCG